MASAMVKSLIIRIQVVRWGGGLCLQKGPSGKTIKLCPTGRNWIYELTSLDPDIGNRLSTKMVVLKSRSIASPSNLITHSRPLLKVIAEGPMESGYVLVNPDLFPAYLPIVLEQIPLASAF